MKVKVGVELEGFVYRYGEPVDVYEWILSEQGSEEWKIDGVIVKTDAGRHMIELALPPLEINDLSFIPEMIERILRNFPKEWKFFWQGYDPGDLPAESLWAPKQRYFALQRALSIESPERWKGVHQMTKVASVHVHLDADFEDGGQIVALLNTFNNADDLRRRFATQGRVAKWFGWADPRRLPNKRNGRIFSSYEDLKEFIGRIPRLLRYGEGGLEPDLKTRSLLGDPLSEGTLWWWARPRKSLGTVEVRIADSMVPEKIPDYIRELLRLV